MKYASGDRLGAYEILAPIGAGGMGVVYLATDHRLDRRVAIKVLSEPDGGDDRRLRSEARAIAALNHPHICTIYEIDEHAGNWFIVMEHIDGTPLSAPAPARDLKTTTRLALQIADAVAHAHERGIVHRDLKTSNLMVTSDGRVKVLDFGIARRMAQNALDETTRSTANAPHQFVGTLAYMAPESLRGAVADPRSDVWAIGVVLFELLAYRRPFLGATTLELATAILRDEPAPLGPSVPGALQAVIRRCLAKDAAGRYPHARALRDALETVSFDAQAAPTALTSIRAIAVLPLKNLATDMVNDFFTEGMTDALIAELVQVSGIRVIARDSVMRFKAGEHSAADIARHLGVDALVTGSVLRAGDTVRVTAGLIDGKSESHLWARSYEERLSDVIALQRRVAGAIAREIRGAASTLAGPVAAQRQVEPAAYMSYLKGRYHWKRLTIEGVRKALEHFQAALAIDPTYAQAYAGVATSHGGLAWTGAEPPRQSLARSKAAALQALALDPSASEAYMNLGYVALNEWDWRLAEQHLRHAIALDPGASEYLLFLSFVFTSLRRHDEAIATLERAQQIDPLSPLIANNLAYQSYLARRFASARRYCDVTFTLDPTFAMAHWIAGVVSTAEGDDAAAVQQIERAAAVSPGVGVLGWLGFAYGRGGRQTDARGIIDRLRSLGPEWTARLPEIARVQVALGENEAALATIEEACEVQAIGLQYAAVDPSMDPIRSDPRYQTVLRKMGLVE